MRNATCFGYQDRHVQVGLIMGESFRHRGGQAPKLRGVKPRTPAFIDIVILLLFLLLRSARVVPAGHVGVVDLFGNVRSEALPSGLHLINPLASVHRLSVHILGGDATTTKPVAMPGR